MRLSRGRRAQRQGDWRRHGAHPAQCAAPQRLSLHRPRAHARPQGPHRPARTHLPSRFGERKEMIRRLAAFAFAFAAALTASAQTDYPARTVTMVVPFPPGGVADITARPVAEAMTRILKQTVVVENKSGAGGGVGMQYVARAKPDGYTLLMALSSISIIPEADKVLGRDPMYQLGQFIPIARFTADPTVLAVRADSPYKSVKDLIDAAKQNPGTIPYGSSGNYGTMHVPMEMLDGAAGVKMLHVPFTGAGPAVVALLGGQVQALSTGPSSIMGQYKSGKVRVLATWGDARHPAFPDVPTLKE